MTRTPATTVKVPTGEPARSGAATWMGALAVAACAAVPIFYGLGDEPHFADESAMVAQSYYYRLVASGRWNDADWLHPAAFDHPPLPKYLVGLALHLAGQPVPDNLDRWMEWMGYRRGTAGWEPAPSGGDFSPPDSDTLYWARVPSALFAVAGVAAIFLLGVQVGGRVVGVLAALFLTLDPLYLTHARRTMPDSFTECLVISSVALAAWGVRQLWSSQFSWGRWAGFVVAGSLLPGLATLTKLNGAIAAAITVSMLLVAWGMALGQRLSRRSGSDPTSHAGNLLAGPLAAAAILAGTFLVFVGLNPYMTARPPLADMPSRSMRALAAQDPIERARHMVTDRQERSLAAMQNPVFAADRLATPAERLRMTLWEGFGRFSPLGPRDIRTATPRRAESFRDYRRATALVWLPLCALGFCRALRTGWTSLRSGRAPSAWAIVAYTAAVLALVIGFIPLNWDRYYLPIQPCAAVLAANALVGAVVWGWSQLVLAPQGSPLPLPAARDAAGRV